MVVFHGSVSSHVHPLEGLCSLGLCCRPSVNFLTDYGIILDDFQAQAAWKDSYFSYMVTKEHYYTTMAHPYYTRQGWADFVCLGGYSNVSWLGLTRINSGFLSTCGF